MKRKALTITICFLAMVAIVSVGFAAWIITTPVADGVQTGTIVAESVTTENAPYTITLSWEDESIIVFGKPSDYSKKPTDWLTNDGADNTDSLSCTLTITVSDKSKLDTDLTLSLKSVIADDEYELNNLDTAFGKAVKQNYISMPTIKVGSGSANEYTPGTPITISKALFESTGSVDVVIEFGWGTYIEGQNPYVYYNNYTYAEKNADAKTVLDAIYDIAKVGTSYKVVVSPKLS